MKKSFRYNNHGVKSSSDQYRNIGGIHFVCWTSDPSEFDAEREKARVARLKTRVINGELYIEQKEKQ